MGEQGSAVESPHVGHGEAKTASQLKSTSLFRSFCVRVSRKGGGGGVVLENCWGGSLWKGQIQQGPNNEIKCYACGALVFFSWGGGLGVREPRCPGARPKLLSNDDSFMSQNLARERDVASVLGAGER